jgi:hypothetical protein
MITIGDLLENRGAHNPATATRRRDDGLSMHRGDVGGMGIVLALPTRTLDRHSLRKA